MNKKNDQINKNELDELVKKIMKKIEKKYLKMKKINLTLIYLILCSLIFYHFNLFCFFFVFFFSYQLSPSFNVRGGKGRAMRGGPRTSWGSSRIPQI